MDGYGVLQFYTVLAALLLAIAVIVVLMIVWREEPSSGFGSRGEREDGEQRGSGLAVTGDVEDKEPREDSVET